MDLMRFREVIPNQASQEKWKDIVLNTGGSQSTLQDIKVAEKASGYCFKYNVGSSNRNRFIYWRTSHDILELCETSLDVTLTDNHVRYKFSESPVLAVHIAEQHESVVILVATVNSVHRLYFLHPEKLSQGYSGDYRNMSIFKEASVAAAKEPTTFHVFGQHSSTNNPIPHLATCCLSEDGREAYFAMACNTNLVLYTMNSNTGETTNMELRQSQIMPRIFTGIAGALRGKNAAEANFVNSIMFKVLNKQLFLYSLHRDDQIRMWSLRKGQCVANVNCFQEYGESRTQGTQSNSFCDGPDNTICTFLSFTSGCEFKTFETFDEENGQFSISLLNTIPAPQFDLIDYKMTSNRIWALWCNSEGEFDVSSICLEVGGQINWVSVGLEIAPDQININSDADPKQEFCSYIFNPGRFQRSTIAKALVMFRRSNILADADLPVHLLKDRVCQAIEMELQNEVKDFDVSDDEFVDLNLQLWERFYSCCEQYHTKASQPIGLVALEQLGGMCIVKKNMFSLVRPCEFLEHLMLASDQLENGELEFEAEDRENYGNLIKLVGILSSIDRRLPNEMKIEIYSKLYELQMPTNVVSELIRKAMSQDYENQPLSREFLTELRQKLMTISDIPNAMMFLMHKLRLSDFDDQIGEIGDYHELSELQKNLDKVGNLFCSSIGKSVVSESLKQITAIRFSLCRNLLVLQQILIETLGLSNDTLERIRSHCMPETVIFVQSYFVMKWICETPISTRQIAINQKYDAINQLLTSLHLFDSFPKHSVVLASSDQTTLLEYFLKGRGSILSLVNLVKSEKGREFQIQVLNGAVNWQLTLIELLTRVGELIWPVTGGFVFGEWLIGTNQTILIEEYVRLNSWCEWNRCSREFILAVTMLNNGELYKAYDYFMRATRGVYTEKFLFNKILGCSADNQNLCKQTVIAQYYLKVIQLFEQKLALDCVIGMAEAAIKILSEIEAENGDQIQSQMAMFQSIVFMNHLKLEHFEEAYDSLINNVELERRREGLRQLVVCLFQKKRLDLLMHLPYVGLQSEFENIVEMRGRSMGIEENVHYKFLYAYHITKQNMRKAAFCMYEQAMRFQLECDTVSATEARYEGLLTCVNALNLVDPKYQFIAKPVVTRDHQRQAEKVVVEVLEIKDIKQEIVHTEAILALNHFQNRHSHQNPDGKILRLNAPELIGVLSSAHLYTMAIKVAREFHLNLEPIIKNLTSTCIDLSEEVFPKTDCWHWLQENNVTDLPPSNSPVNTAWNLLKKLVLSNENENEVKLKRACSEQILSSGSAFLPQWLLMEYRQMNSNELLHLFVKHGRLVEASEFAVELVWAMLGRGHEYFGLNNALLANAPALCFPINTMDLLLYNLKINIHENGNKMLEEDLEQLKLCLKNVSEICQYYKEKLVQVSKDKAQYEKHVVKAALVV